jgi:hypothetical protein
VLWLGAVAAGAEALEKSEPAGWRNPVYGSFSADVEAPATFFDYPTAGFEQSGARKRGACVVDARPDEAEPLAFGVLKSDRGNALAAQISVARC